MADDARLAALKNAYAVWNDSKGQRTDAWLELAADDIAIASVGAADGVLPFGKTWRTKSEFAAYLAAILADWTMVHWTPETYVCDGDRIAVFGRCAWTSRKTGKTAEVRIVNLWTFRGTKAIGFLEIFDTARAGAAAVA